jgi:autotransporter-associated beta strand protein
MGAGNYAGAITTGSGAIIFSSSANQILSGNIGGGTLTKNTSAISTLTLSGTNTYSGVTTIGAGNLQFAKQTSLYNNVTGNWTAARINVKSGANLAFNVGGTGEFTTSNVTTLLTNLAASSSATNGMNAGSSLGFDTTNASGGTFTIGDVIADTTGTSGGVRGLTKLGTGALVLTSTNTNTGATVVTGGTLLVNGSISTSILTTVESGATIGGSGTVGALTVLAGGNINPGNSPGILNTGTYIQSGLYTAEIAGVTPGTQYDQISVTGTVDITGGSLMTMFSGTGYAAGDLIFILLNDSTDAIAGTYTGFAQGDTVASHDGFNWQIYYDADSVGNTFNNGNDTALFAVVIPEPSTALLGALGLLALLRRRR